MVRAFVQQCGGCRATLGRTQWFKDREPDIYEWFGKNLHCMVEPSFRHYVRAGELKAAGMVWTEVLELEEENGRAGLAAEILASDIYQTTMEKVRVFVQRGGGCRATWRLVILSFPRGIASEGSHTACIDSFGVFSGQKEFSMSVTYINEYPHPRLIVMLDPYPDKRGLDVLDSALDLGASAFEVPIRLRSNGEVVWAHDEGQENEPGAIKLSDVIERVLARKGGWPTVLNDGHQFFLVLALKDPSETFGDALLATLEPFRSLLSTAVGPGDPPRPLTAILTSEKGAFLNHPARLARSRELCLVEEADYKAVDGIVAHSSDPFLWFAFDKDQAIHSEGANQGQVNAQHQRRFNVRIFYTDDEPDADLLRAALATGADSVNARPKVHRLLNNVIGDQEPRGLNPGLAMRGQTALLVWEGASGQHYLYTALGSITPNGLLFSRQTNLTDFLADSPLAKRPATAFLPDGRLLIVYEGTGENRLWYVSGRFTSLDRFLTFDGKQHELTQGQARRGSTPAIAFGPGGRVVVVYQGTDEQKLFYVSGTVDGEGKINGNEFSLTQGQAQRGFTPAIAFGPGGRVLVVYRGTDGEKLFYVSGFLDSSGKLNGTEFQLTINNSHRGFTPTVAFDDSGRAFILYTGTDAAKLFYVFGELDGQGRIHGSEVQLNMGMDRT
jgi:hypothetical protein